MYTSPAEVTITRNAGLVQDAYEAAYKKRYNSSPFIETEDLVVFVFLSKNFGLEQGKALVEHYLTMNDEWFMRQAHNPRTLRKDVNKVIADHGIKKSRNTQSVDVAMRVWCDWCGADTIASEADEFRLCTSCRQRPYPTISDVDAQLNLLTSEELKSDVRDLICRAMRGEHSKEYFGKVASKNLKKHSGGEFVGENWAAYSNALGLAWAVISEIIKEGKPAHQHGTGPSR
jgi:hypothetical protein